MSTTQIELQLIAAVVAAACALPGVFLVLRQMAMMSDAISHTVLLGIVLMFFVVGSLDSPLLIAGAAATGLITVMLVEILGRTKLVKYDAAIGLVFPALFSIAVILISRYAGGVHLDTDSVLLGELAFAPFDRLTFLGISAPRALWVMGGIGLLNLALILLFYKELKLATFDAGLAAAMGFSPALIHYGLMAMVSITAVGAFDAVGSILLVAFMVTPAASAYLLTDELKRMLGISVAIGVVSAICGYWIAHWVDVNIAGAMATMTGVTFLITLLFAPNRGLIAVWQRRERQRWEFAQTMLAIHLAQHEGDPDEVIESRTDHLLEHFRWQPDFAEGVIRYAENRGTVRREAGLLYLTDSGRTLVSERLVV